MSGQLPLLSLRISDNKLRSVLELVHSIPLPKSKPAARSSTPSTMTQATAAKARTAITFFHMGG